MHPLGGSGAVLATRLVHHMPDSGIRYGLQTMCEGGGIADATILELLRATPGRSRDPGSTSHSFTFRRRQLGRAWTGRGATGSRRPMCRRMHRAHRTGSSSS
ncbi:hypothetical protein [Pseudonocardia acidicola]|uniref:hypothetical protein n=1 Tax=Pseudonocardia acidicola TaxID=2724939 RepID=UPI003B832DA2